MFKKIILSTALIALSANVSASVISQLNDGSWTVMSGASEDQTVDNLGPGYGGQFFDAEYLLYKFDTPTNVLSIALQTGFDITGDNKIDYKSKDYWGGDLALSFNGVTLGDSSSYEYAIDFGQETRTYNGTLIGTHGAGLYKNVTWADNNAIHFQNSNPFAMSAGTLDASVAFTQGFGTNILGAVDSNSTSYFKTMSFDLDDIEGLLLSDITQIDAHWTMSCGNDAIDGHATVPVPEPASLLLFSAGFMGLMGSLVARRRRKIS